MRALASSIIIGSPWLKRNFIILCLHETGILSPTSYKSLGLLKSFRLGSTQTSSNSEKRISFLAGTVLFPFQQIKQIFQIWLWVSYFISMWACTRTYKHKQWWATFSQLSFQNAVHTVLQQSWKFTVAYVILNDILVAWKVNKWKWKCVLYALMMTKRL